MSYEFICQNPQCGKKFVDTNHKKGRKFCSRECIRYFNRTRFVREFICQNPNCGKTFTVGNGEKNRLYCSRQCSGEAQRSQVTAPCANCGALLRKEASWAKRIKHFFCNKKCHNEWQDKHYPRGKESPKYKGGRPYSYGHDWEEQKRKARERDSNQCRRCGKSKEANGRAMDVHHIIPFRKFGFERHKEANALTNLVSLCRSCHMRVEYGKEPLQPPLL